MNVLFYSAALTGIGMQFLRIVVSHIPQERIEICRSMAALDSRLHKPLEGLAIAALHVTVIDELGALITRRDLLADFRTILLLPDCAERTTSLAHILRPRFVIYSDADLPDSSVVLGNMLQGKKNNPTANCWDGQTTGVSTVQ